jgi:hypothetical protein
MLRFILGGMLVLSSCNRPATTNPTATSPKIVEVTGTQKERVSAVSAIITKFQALPTAIIDAHSIQEQIGDGYLGPSDFRSFSLVVVAPRDVTQWHEQLKPIANKPEYAQPDRSCSWWVSPAAFNSLQFYQPGALTHGRQGWVGISRQTGRIYIFSFTT